MSITVCLKAAKSVNNNILQIKIKVGQLWQVKPDIKKRNKQIFQKISASALRLSHFENLYNAETMIITELHTFDNKPFVRMITNESHMLSFSEDILISDYELIKDSIHA